MAKIEDDRTEVAFAPHRAPSAFFRLAFARTSIHLITQPALIAVRGTINGAIEVAQASEDH